MRKRCGGGVGGSETGLTYAEVDDLGILIRELGDQYGFSALLVEHHIGLVMNLCDHVAAMNFGRTIVDGAPQDVQRDHEIVAANLGRPA